MINHGVKLNVIHSAVGQGQGKRWDHSLFIGRPYRIWRHDHALFLLIRSLNNVMSYTTLRSLFHRSDGSFHNIDGSFHNSDGLFFLASCRFFRASCLFFFLLIFLDVAYHFETFSNHFETFSRLRCGGYVIFYNISRKRNIFVSR